MVIRSARAMPKGGSGARRLAEHGESFVIVASCLYNLHPDMRPHFREVFVVDNVPVFALCTSNKSRPRWGQKVSVNEL